MTDFDPRIEDRNQDGDSHPQTSGRDSPSGEQRRVSKQSTEVTPKRKKRRFSAAAKLRIVIAADACTKHGELGALLRREGLYSAQIASWRRLRDQGGLGSLTDKKRGKKPASVNPLAAQLAEAERRNQILTRKLERAEEIIQVQKKFAEMFGKIITLPEDIEKM